MGVATSPQKVLDDLASQLATRIPTAIDDLISDGSPALVDPAAVAVLSDIDSPIPAARPHVALSITGSPEIEELGSPFRYNRIPVTVSVTHSHDTDIATSEKFAWYYCRAVDLALTRTRDAGSISGVFQINNISTSVEPTTANRGGRAARVSVVSCTVHFKEQRGT